MLIAMLVAVTFYSIGFVIAGFGLVSKRKDWARVTKIGLAIMLIGTCVAIGTALIDAWLCVLGIR